MIKCSKCGRELPETMFYPSNLRIHHYKCKECIRAVNREQRARRKALGLTPKRPSHDKHVRPGTFVFIGKNGYSLISEGIHFHTNDERYFYEQWGKALHGEIA